MLILYAFTWNIYLLHRDDGKYFEYHFIVKVPQQVLNSQKAADKSYKYHVESSATEKDQLKSLELICGPTPSHGVIDRSLKLHTDKIIPCNCKFFTCSIFSYICII